MRWAWIMAAAAVLLSPVLYTVLFYWQNRRPRRERVIRYQPECWNEDQDYRP